MFLTVRTHSQETKHLGLNQIQVIGTHNSYHAGLAPSQMALVRQTDPKLAMALDYRHPSLDAQLTGGARLLELDVLLDSQGGKYSHPTGLAEIEERGLPADAPFDPTHELAKPGYKVMHNPDYDYRSNCQPFKNCLAIINEWSKEHPTHAPIFVFVENKKFGDLTTKDLDALDDEVLSVFQTTDLIRPDDVRGGYATLREAVTTSGWPSLVQGRGKVVFLLAKEELRKAYTNGHPNLENRVMFTNAISIGPDQAFIVMPESGDPLIHDRVRAGFLVLTRADIDTLEARTNSTKRRDKALASGAQLISTDYPPAEPAVGTGYRVTFGGSRVVRCDPVLTGGTCNLSHPEAPF
jgi:hypothetical protein